jgi:cytochrome b involved in lipid metabolism
VSLSWTATAGATSYEVLQEGSQVGTSTGTAYTATGLTNGMSYSFTVRAVNAGGSSAASAASSVIPAAPVLPTTPVSTSALASHGTADDCWVAINGVVYDMATFIGTHSGGPGAISGVCGKDGTAVFTSQHGNAVEVHVAAITRRQVGTYADVTPAPGSYTLAQVLAHATGADCWASIAGTVYDLTAFLSTHSGGSGPIVGSCGTDATSTFYTRHGGSADSKLGILSAYLKGPLVGYVAAALPSQAAAPTVEAVTGGGEYTMDDVAAHSTEGDCWTVIGGAVYGLSTWIPVHPGGSGVVAMMCGVDGTGSYNSKHAGGGGAGAILARIRLGTLVATRKPAATPTTYTAADVAAHKTAADCWSVVNGVVYDLTKWVPQHPGGSAAIVAMCGVDGTASYNGKHGQSTSIKSGLDAFAIGSLAGEPASASDDTVTIGTPARSFSMLQVRRHSSVANCWTVINGNVYNFTTWSKKHARQRNAIKAVCGKEATKVYTRTHGGTARAVRSLRRYLVGKVAAPVTAATPPTTVYSLGQVAGHSGIASCLSIVNGGVYDLTTWIGRHPGGAAVIRAMCGKDGTASFQGIHSGSSSAKSALATFKVGVLG